MRKGEMGCVDRVSCIDDSHKDIADGDNSLVFLLMYSIINIKLI